LILNVFKIVQKMNDFT